MHASRQICRPAAARRECDRLTIDPRRASNRRSRLSLTLERVVEHVLRDSLTEHGTVVARRTKVNAGEDAGIVHVLQRLRKAAECSWNTNENIRSQRERRSLAELVGEDRSRRAADARVA